jgi:hypothetical protein
MTLTSPSTTIAARWRPGAGWLLVASVLACASLPVRAQTTAAPPPTALPPTALPSPPGAPACRVVVMNLVARNLQPADGDVTALLTESLAAEVAAVSGCQVVSQADVTQMLDFEAEKAACGEASESCLSEIGSALGAERVVGGTLGRLGGDFVLTAKLMNVRDGTVQARAEQVVRGAVEDLRLAAKNAARQLFGVAVELSASTPPPSTTAPSSAPAPSGLLWAGVVTAATGGLVFVVGGVLAGLAEARLADAGENDKQAIAAEGRTALAAAAVGGGLVVVGGGLVAADALLPE